MTYRKTMLSASIVAALMFTGVAMAHDSRSVKIQTASQTAKPQRTSLQSVQPSSQGANTTPAVSVEAQNAPQTQHENVAQDRTTAASRKKATTLKGVVVHGILASQERSIQVKRNSDQIEDGITARNIGQLPDVSISASLQRVTGVQINRTAGEGSSLNVRGLPEVSTLLDGEVFLTADNINSIQPNYQSLPATLFSGVQVYKSPTAAMATSGISGTVNLETHKPFDFKFGPTISVTAQGGRGSVSKSTKPDVSGLFNYNDGGKWGALVDLSYSDLIRNNGSSGLGTTIRVAGENASSASLGGDGYLTGWAGHGAMPRLFQ